MRTARARARPSLRSGVVLAAVVLWAAAEVRAAVAPARIRVADAEGARRTVLWTPGGFAPGEAVSSAAATVTLLQGGNCTAALATVGRPLAATAGGNGVARLRERVVIGQALTIAARRQGASGLCYQRTFAGAQSQTQVTETLIVEITGPAAADLAVTDVRLRFEDGGTSRILERGEPLVAVAEIAHVGRGRLRAVLELAGPATTVGRPRFRRIALLHRQLAAPGRIVWRIPELPTRISGLYLVRLRFLEPELQAEELILRYYVLRQAPAPAPAALALREPEDGAVLREGLRFAWAPAERAVAYRLEFYADSGRGGLEEEGRPLTGLLVMAGASEATLTALVRDRLTPPGPYLWRVVAFDAEGAVVAASPFRRLRIPARAGVGEE